MSEVAPDSAGPFEGINMEYIAMAAALIVFGAAVGSKLRSRRAFREFVDFVGSYTRNLLIRRIVAVGIALGEAAVVLGLLPPATRPLALVLGATLLIVFAAAMMLREPVRACRCFGGLDRSAHRGVNAAGNLLLGATCIAGAVDPGLTKTPGAITVCIGVGAVAGAAFVVGPSIRRTLTRPGAHA